MTILEDLPPLEPVEPPATIVLGDGRRVVAHRARPGDEIAVLDLYEGLSAESRYTRFFQATPRLTRAVRDLLTDLGRAEVWLAFDGEACVGEARIVPSKRASCADLAVTVADAYQHSGLGHRLARLATGHHRDGCVGVTILPDNGPAVRLARRNHIALAFDDGVLEGQLLLA